MVAHQSPVRQPGYLASGEGVVREEGSQRKARCPMLIVLAVLRAVVL